jgi:hypothetical protein
VDAQPTRHPLGTRLLRIEHHHPGPPLGRHRTGRSVAGVRLGDLHGMRLDARPPSARVRRGRHRALLRLASRPTRRRQGVTGPDPDRPWEASAEDLADLDHVRFLARRQAGQELRPIPLA